MAISKEEKSRFNEASKPDKDQIAYFEKMIKDLTTKKRKFINISSYYNLEIMNIYLELIQLYLHVSDLSNEIMGIKDSGNQEKARKSFGNAILILEEIVGNQIDRPLSENKDYLKKIDRVNIRQTLEICKKLTFVFETLVDNYGENSKYKWSFIDLQVRLANVIKNMVNFSEIEQFRRFDSEFFKDREDLLRLCKNSLEDAAKNARTKYELSTLAPSDIKKAVELLTVLRQIMVLYGETDDAAKTQNVIDALKQRLEAEEKKKEEENIKKKVK